MNMDESVVSQIVADIAGKLVREFEFVVDDVIEVNAGDGGVADENEESGLAFARFVLGNATGMDIGESEVSGHVGLPDAEGFTNLAQLSAEILLPGPRMSHQELPPDLLPVARNICLRSLAVGSTMRSLSIAAASIDLSNSPAMLITRQGGRLSYALAVA